MPIIKIGIAVNAPVERVFDLARCIDLHEVTMSKHGEKAVSGVTKGLINFGESVMWRAKHFGVSQKLTSKITAFECPRYFRDTMISGAFARFDHDHFFDELNGKTLMRDVFDYESPLWIFGKIADAVFLEGYMKNLLTERNELIKQTAESENWRKFI